MSIHKEDITAVILAGGQGRRMGGQDKGLLEFDGRLMIEILIEQLQNQQLDILINANRNQATYRSYGYPVIGDDLKDYQGPLAGFASAMATVKTSYILPLPCDSPKLAGNFVDRFIETFNHEKSPVCVAHDGERLQPVYALIETRFLDKLKQCLDSGERKNRVTDKRRNVGENGPVGCLDFGHIVGSQDSDNPFHRVQRGRIDIGDSSMCHRARIKSCKHHSVGTKVLCVLCLTRYFSEDVGWHEVLANMFVVSHEFCPDARMTPLR